MHPFNTFISPVHCLITETVPCLSVKEEDPSPEGLTEGRDQCLSSVLPGTSERVSVT